MIDADGHGVRDTAPCPFCDFQGELVRSFGDVIVFGPLSPVTPGHVLVVPREHVADFAESPRLSARVMEMAALYAHEARLGPCNLITSRGPEATQTVFHLHVHLVPRCEGDGLLLPWSERSSVCAIHGSYDPDQRGPGYCPRCVANEVAAERERW